MGKTLQRVRGFAHELVITQQGSVLTLSASGVRHTVVDLSALHVPGLEYARHALVALAFNPRARSFLVLGLGGASIPHMFRAARPSATLDAVEIDPVVVEVARKFFQVHDSAGFRIHVEDAASYLAGCSGQYDVIVQDTYVGDSLPAHCSDREFFANAAQRLAKNGLMVVNWMRGDRQEYRSLISGLEQTIGPVWLLKGYASHNTLVFASQRAMSRSTLLQQAEEVQRELPFSSAIVRFARNLHRPPD